MALLHVELLLVETVPELNDGLHWSLLKDDSGTESHTSKSKCEIGNLRNKHCKLKMVVFNSSTPKNVYVYIPVGGLFFIADEAAEDTADEADDAVIVGGEGDEEKCAATSDEIFIC